MKCRIAAIEYQLPTTVEEAAALRADNPDWDIAQILEKTGVHRRYIAAEGETAADLAFQAGQKLLDRMPDAEGIDLLIVVTQSPDYVLPTTACILQHRLGLPKSCMAFDVNLGCSGFVYALSIAGGLLESGIARKAMILCADTYTKYIGPHDRTCRPIFSDGASAVLIERSDADAIGPFEFGTDGSGAEHLIVKNSGARDWRPAAGQAPCRLEMHGSSVFMFTMDVVPRSVTALLTRASLSLDAVDLVIFHQASKFVIDNLVRRLALPESKVFNNYSTVGNTVSATIPIALKDALDAGRLTNGSTVLIAGFGVGLSWGVALIRASLDR